MKLAPSCTLYAILARKAPKAVILRRGPSQWVQCILWHTDTDTFEFGQWFHGRIYSRRCDLSPDGALFIYFCNKINRRTLRDQEYTCAWTAISRPPYLTALALWPKGDCWHGGGLFEFNRTVWLNHRPEVAKAHKDHQPRGLKVTPNPMAGGEDWPVYSRRLQRDGWTLVHHGSFKWHSRGATAEHPEVWHRPHPAGPLMLRMQTVAYNWRNPGGSEVMRFDVTDQKGRELLAVDDARWADWDHRGRLVLARGGQLIAYEPQGDTLGEPRVLADFSERTHEPVPPPEWATRWPWED